MTVSCNIQATFLLKKGKDYQSECVQSHTMSRMNSGAFGFL